MENKTKLVRMNPYLAILSVWSEKSERYFSLCNILFYDENGVIVGTNSGHFDNDEELEFNGEVVRKLKVDFSTKQNFVVRDKDSNSVWENHYKLYICIGNVDFKYLGLRKQVDSVYRIYTVNGVEIKKHIKYLKEEIWELKAKITDERDKIDEYELPLEKETMKEICNNLIKYNDLLLEEDKKLKEYVPKEEDFIEE